MTAAATAHEKLTTYDYIVREQKREREKREARSQREIVSSNTLKKFTSYVRCNVSKLSLVSMYWSCCLYCISIVFRLCFIAQTATLCNATRCSE
jgi:hypothetical protein